MKTTSTAALLAILTTASLCAADKALPNQPAPPLRLEKLLQAPPDAVATWDALKGKVVVLEFWATWCGPCIEAVPHLNELAEEFEKQPVRFIAITDEKESVVQPFLRRKAMSAWVGLDTDRSMFKDYGVSGIPHTVIVGTNGIVAAVTHPASLSSTHIKNVLAGKSAGLPKPSREEKTVAAKPTDDAGPPPIFQVLIRPSDDDEGGGSSSSGPSRDSPYGKLYKSKITGWSAKSLVLWAAKTTEVRLITNCALPEGKFDVLINIPYRHRERTPELMPKLCAPPSGWSSAKRTANWISIA
jgi:thiol-disulfide isomerase/thioredoxin